MLTYDLSGIVSVMGTCFVVLAYNLFEEWSSLVIAVVSPLIIANLGVLFHKPCQKDSMHCQKVLLITLTQALTYASAVIGYLYFSTDFHKEVIYPRMFTAFA